MRITYICLLVSIFAGCTTTHEYSLNDSIFKKHPHGITEFTLDNGMKVLIKEDHRAPMAVIQIWYRIGSNDEPNGLTGMSHALEHMMFKGTPKYPAGKLTEAIKREGGQYNAFTGSDYTAYYEIFEKSRMPISFQIESDRMVNLVMSEKDFAKEIEVVKEERRLRVDDKPRSRLYERLYATALNSSPNRRPVIGWMDDLKTMKLSDLKDWYHRWYAPNNAVLMVAGDVDPEEVYRLAIRYMAPLKPTPLPKHKPQKEPQQYGEKRITIKLPAEQPYIGMAYHAPSVGQADDPWEPYALIVLKSVLSSGGDSRFSKRLVRGKQIAQYVSIGYNLYSRYDDLFTFFSEPVKGVNITEIESAIEEEIEKVKREGINNKELERIKTKVYAQEIYSRDSVVRQAYSLASLEILGVGWQATYDFFDRIKEVTAEQVQTVAKKYLVKDKRTIAILDPQPINQQATEK